LDRNGARTGKTIHPHEPGLIGYHEAYVIGEEFSVSSITWQIRYLHVGVITPVQDVHSAGNGLDVERESRGDLGGIQRTQFTNGGNTSRKGEDLVELGRIVVRDDRDNIWIGSAERDRAGPGKFGEFVRDLKALCS